MGYPEIEDTAFERQITRRWQSVSTFPLLSLIPRQLMYLTFVTRPSKGQYAVCVASLSCVAVCNTEPRTLNPPEAGDSKRD